jgi:hypothetical protein
LDLSWKKAKKLLGRADPERRKSFIGQIDALLEGARDERHTLVYLDEAHIHQDVDLGHGWCERGQRFYVASSSPGLAAKVSFYGLYLYNEGQVRIWSYARAKRRAHHRCDAPAARRDPRGQAHRDLGWGAVSSGQGGVGGGGKPEQSTALPHSRRN